MLINISFLRNFVCIKARDQLLILLFFSTFTYSQTISEIKFGTGQGLMTDSIGLSDSTILSLSAPRPLFSFVLGGKYYTSADFNAIRNNGVFSQTVNNALKIIVTFAGPASSGYPGEIIFENI